LKINSKKRNSAGVSFGSSVGKAAVGTSAGSIIIWDLQRGVILNKLGVDTSQDGESFGISSISFSSAGSTVFTSSREKYILEWDVETGEQKRKLKGLKHGASKICMHPLGSYLAIAGTGIKIINLESGKTQRKFKTGHACSLTSLAFSSDGRYLAAGCETSRVVNLYSCTDTEQSQVVLTATFPEDVWSFSLLVSSFEAQGVLVAATSLNNSLMLAHLIPEHGPPQVVVVFGPDGAQPCGALAAAFVSGSQELMVCHGSELDPIFECLIVTEKSADGGIQLLSSLSLSKKEKIAITNQAASLTKSQKMGISGGLDFAEGQIVGSGDLGLRGTEVDSLVVQNTSVAKAASTATIAERLKALTAALETTGEEDSHSIHKKSSLERAPPTADSLVVVLEQALQSADEALLEHCLSVNDPQVVGGTVSRLSAVRVVPLLTKLVAKFEKRPQRVPLVAMWVRSLLVAHAGYLASIPNLATQLSKLYQAVDQRLVVYPKLLGLSGRLDLLLSQLPSRVRDDSTSVVDSTTIIPLVLYKSVPSDEESEAESAEQHHATVSPVPKKKEDSSIVVSSDDDESSKTDPSSNFKEQSNDTSNSKQKSSKKKIEELIEDSQVIDLCTPSTNRKRNSRKQSIESSDDGDLRCQMNGILESPTSVEGKKKKNKKRESTGSTETNGPVQTPGISTKAVQISTKSKEKKHKSKRHKNLPNEEFDQEDN